MDSIEFVWDPDKANANYRKHRVSFREAIAVFFDPLASFVHDPDHSEDEERLVAIGRDRRERVLVVAYVERGNVIRIISSRPATMAERRLYEEGP